MPELYKGVKNCPGIAAVIIISKLSYPGFSSAKNFHRTYVFSLKSLFEKKIYSVGILFVYIKIQYLLFEKKKKKKEKTK